MGLHRMTWVAVLVVAMALLADNFLCWKPGIGPTAKGPPVGTELELYYGWPATFYVECWQSEDPFLGSRILLVAPFYRPEGEMDLQDRYFGWLPAGVNVVFTAAAMVLVGLVWETACRQKWSSKHTVIACVCAGLLIAALLAAEPVGVYL
jgi:hypothetical protein